MRVVHMDVVNSLSPQFMIDTPVTPITSVLPLLFVISITAIKQVSLVEGGKGEGGGGYEMRTARNREIEGREDLCSSVGRAEDSWGAEVRGSNNDLGDQIVALDPI